ncbi:DUF2516 family protein [Georgenia muralis]|uniref:Uncharacterized protein DUF2516 n=1 Tax=Georgenia muralis TaxID=154117 RepID=A0A3N4Z821_9MICO|nr:DUF2516 family protein [Georgenia muralis]RPF27350.1 uncharacterized protein DUF2516 [Georgenia muralis]
MLGNVQLLIFLLLAVIMFALEVWALVDAATRPAPAFLAADKRTKNFWLALTGVAAAIGFIAIPPPLGLGLMGGFLQFVAVVPAAVYLADVRPAVRGYRPPRQGQGRGW